VSCHERAAAGLRESGYRLTPQRLMILEAVHHLGRHATADEVLGFVQARHPAMDLSTVYRTLELLRETGLVRTFERPGRAMEYELAADPHHHLVCRDCGSVTRLPDAALRQLAERLAADHGFEADLDHLAIVGLCAGCRAG
jgi:Fur family ferric uptake transcriptional regulator